MAFNMPDANYGRLDTEIAELCRRLDLLDDARQGDDEEVAELMILAAAVKTLWDSLDEHCRGGGLPRVWRDRTPRPPEPEQSYYTGPFSRTPKTPRS
ncbi:hypothetical protein [Nonomuraea sediminis]|uniref:hypothetical protein n=1 Tax=Nonomuraea sediminis TaxID=2835864 RepID=UPI001BDC95A4|nr:hypothetical protein [Nonomuraea sediminis]